MENYTLNKIVEFAKMRGITELVAEYIPTAKNGIVKNHYSDLGFYDENGKWKLDLNNFQFGKVFISELTTSIS